MGGIVFYAFGDLKYVLLLLGLCAANYGLAFVCHDAPKEGRQAGKIRAVVGLPDKELSGEAQADSQRRMFVGIVILDVFVLILFKTLSFVMNTPIPLGISFYIFKMLSFQADLYTGRIKKMPSLPVVLAYFTLFFQLAQGPIMRFDPKEFTRRRHRFSLKRIEEGMKFLIIGLAMKVLLADKLAILWSEASKIGYAGLSTPLAWFAIIGFLLQLYLDFWGYSLMAAGIGVIIGFSFIANFNHPYAALSVGEFYRRWHMTLTSWFKDYVYIPLGGSRSTTQRTLLNIMIVWLLTGFWHGGALHYILWGLALGVIICVEKAFAAQLEQIPAIGRRLILIFLMPFTWVLFAVERPTDIAVYFSRMLPLTGRFAGANAADFGRLFGYFWLYVALGIVLCIPAVYRWIEKPKAGTARYAEAVILCVLLWISLYTISISSANPFLYVKF